MATEAAIAPHLLYFTARRGQTWDAFRSAFRQRPVRRSRVMLSFGFIVIVVVVFIIIPSRIKYSSRHIQVTAYIVIQKTNWL